MTEDCNTFAKLTNLICPILTNNHYDSIFSIQLCITVVQYSRLTINMYIRKNLRAIEETAGLETP